MREHEITLGILTLLSQITVYDRTIFDNMLCIYFLNHNIGINPIYFHYVYFLKADVSL